MQHAQHNRHAEASEPKLHSLVFHSAVSLPELLEWLGADPVHMLWQTRQAPAVGLMSPPPPVRAGVQSTVKAGTVRQTASLDNDFPSLGGAFGATQERSANGGGDGHLGEMPAAANGGVSEGLKAANKVLSITVDLIGEAKHVQQLCYHFMCNHTEDHDQRDFSYRSSSTR